MKKALLMGVSGAAMILASSAYASGMVGQEQGFKLTNNQGQYQDTKAMADGGDAGKGDAYAAGGDAGGSYSSKYGNNSAGGDGGYAKAYGGAGDGGDAYTSGKQDQGQEQYMSGNQKQVVYLPDINITMPEEQNGGAVIDGGAFGPGVPGEGDAIAVEGDENRILSHEASDDAIIADRSARVARQVDGVAVLGDTNTVNLDSFNVAMDNNTVMTGANTIGPISLDSGDSEGGYAEAGDLDLTQDAHNHNDGRGGDGRNDLSDLNGGEGGSGGDGLALSANLAIQALKSENETEGGDGSAYSKSYGSSYSKADAKASADSYSKTYGEADNDVNAGAPGAPGNSYSAKYGKSPSGESQADAGGEAGNWQDVYTGSDAGAGPESKAYTKLDTDANGAGGEAGPIHSDASNDSQQDTTSMASGGLGGEGGDVKGYANAHGGDNAQMASSAQTANAATGGTQGGDGGNIAVSFGTGNIGAISLGTVSGIATMAQNTGLSANQFTSFSINAHTSF